jgi:amino acid transporter
MADEPKKTTTSYETLGAKKLGLKDVVAQSVGFMGPVFSAAFLVPLVVGVTSATGKGGGVAAPVSVIIAAIGVIALGWIVSRYTRQIQSAGSLYDYVSRGLGPKVGVASGFLYYCGIIVLSVGLIVLVGGYVHDTIESEFKVTPLPGWAWSCLLIALLFVTLYFGVRISTRMQLALALVSFLVVLGFFIMVIVKLGHENTWAPFKPSSSAQGWSGIFFGVVYGVLLFVGFETAANLGEETKDPKREIPLAVMMTAGIAAVFFVLAAYVQVAGFHLSLKAITSAAAAPLFALGAPATEGGYGGLWIDRLLELVVLFDMIAVTIGTGVAGSRGVFALARDRRIPSVLARTSRKYGTPVAAILLMVGLAIVNVLITQFWTSLFALPGNPHYFSIFAWDSTLGGFALVVVYLLMSLGSLRTFRAGSGATFAAAVGIAITGGAIWASFYKVPRPTLWAPVAAVGLLIVGFIIAFTTKGRRAAALQMKDLAVNPDLARVEPLAVVDPEGGIVAEHQGPIE